MPHIIVEYSPDLEETHDIPGLLQKLHEALAAQGIDAARIKTRGIDLTHAYVGTKGFAGSMIHITLLLLAGRDVSTKKQYGDALRGLVKAAVSEASVTLEIRDMDPETYYL